MPQHKVKQKVKLPAGVQRRSGHITKKQQQAKKNPGKRSAVPKNPAVLEAYKLQQAVTKSINARNEEMIASKAQTSVNALQIAGPSSK